MSAHASGKKLVLGAAAVIAAGAAYYFWAGKAEPENKKPRNPVQTIKSGIAQQKTIPVVVQANGYVTPLNTVEVRPQMQNIVRAVHVKEGQDVKAGQLLFTLDQRSDAASQDRAHAQLMRDRAELADAEANLKRNQELLAKKFVSQAVVDTARARAEALRSTLKADQATLAQSSVALGNNKITASISGRLGAINVHPGSLAQPSGAPMVTIAQLEPVSVSFAIPEKELAHLLASYPNADAPVTAQLVTGQEFAGKLFFIDNASDPQTGTIRMKAQFPNRDRKLWPGAFVNVRLVARTLPNAVLIPAQSIVNGPVDKFVYMVQPDDTVKPQKIDMVTIENGQAAVTGLQAGAKIVIEGTQNLRPGAKVKEAQAAPAEGKKREAKPGDKKSEKANAKSGGKNAG